MAFMRFAWLVQPRNLLLFSCHFCNEIVQLRLLGRRLLWERNQKKLGLDIYPVKKNENQQKK